ncbi:Pheromone/general odorant binding protein [Trinorchestia longiramus]|nr:Pheromone/general odorant binding protein [Trinorchestia longiramus]
MLNYHLLFVQKRSPRYPASKVQHLAEEIQTEVDYFRCVMTEMGITDANNKLKAEAIVARIKSASLAKDLEDSMVHAVTECQKYALCVPPGKDSYPLPNDVVATKHYLFCENELRSLACLKHDARWLVDDFDLRGADHRLDFLPSDQDRVTALLFANNFVGPDDFGLYE